MFFNHCKPKNLKFYCRLQSRDAPICDNYHKEPPKGENYSSFFPQQLVFKVVALMKF